MVGPIMAHHRKEKSAYKNTADDMGVRKPELRNLLALGTYGEVALLDAFIDVWQGTIKTSHLFQLSIMLF